MTHDEKRKIYQLLAAPFPEEAIERTEGRITGRGYNTTGIKYQYVINRLNEVLGIGGYRAHRIVAVREITTAKGRQAFEAVCDLTLQLGEWINGEFVAWAEALADGGHTSTNEADARKGAFTNGLKKAAAMLGCGKQAYEGTIDDDHVPGADAEPYTQAPAPAQPRNLRVVQRPPGADAPAPTRTTTRAGESPIPTSPAPAATSVRNRLTAKQLAAIWSMGRQAGFDQAALRREVKSRYGVQPEYLTKEQASGVITLLGSNAPMNNGHASRHETLREPGMEG